MAGLASMAPNRCGHGGGDDAEEAAASTRSVHA
jgi:hypothetical protein